MEHNNDFILSIYLCNEARAKHSDGTAALLVTEINVSIVKLGFYENEYIKLPLLFCNHERIPNFSFRILELHDDEIPLEEIYFIFGITDTTKYSFIGLHTEDFPE